MKIENQIQDISESQLIPCTEEELAQYIQNSGKQVVQHRGCFWKETFPGFYQPLHWMECLRVEQAICPPKLHWGFQCALREEDMKFCNNFMPIHVLSNLEKYDEQSLSSNRRYLVRKGRKKVKVFQLIDNAILQEQGYEVFVSSTRRKGSKPCSREKYVLNLQNDSFAPKNRLIIAGFIDQKLSGYITGYGINKTAYLDKAYYLTEALSTNIGTLLTFEFVQACRRSGKIKQVVNGLHLREDPSLSIFKESMGFSLKHIPIKLQINPIVAKLIQWRYPDKYYRLTGS
ncbi:hypothetical protein IQ238_10940 [Pleurocapsales cyanobacterium LEGE 06147]|nr:hypothetical protein [Pleurocapsales cyanobacterium LEGE 06147]